jgi:hypothetical protein
MPSCISPVALLTVILALGCDGPEDPAAPSTPASVPSAAMVQVPFKASFDGTGTASVVEGDRCADLTVHILGTGIGTHLGRLTTDQSHCATATSLAFTGGEFTLTAANGDQLQGTYSGVFEPLEPPLFSVDGAFTFTGGTGRFAGATGGGDASGVQNLATGDATVSLLGTISNVGSD